MSDEDDRDQELEEIIHSSATRAEALYPKTPLSFQAKIGIAFVGLMLTLNAILSGVNSHQLREARACQVSQTAQLSVLRSSNQTASSEWIDRVTDSIVSGKLDKPQLKELRRQYHETINQNNKKIDAVRSVKCG